MSRRVNRWYGSTYDAIFEMAPWNDFAADVEKKLVCVFAWMPQTIMSIKHSKKRTKADLYNASDVTRKLGTVRNSFEEVRGQRLLDAQLENLTEPLEKICDALFPVLGSVAASKYLHFSAPCFFPMWDTGIRKRYKQEDSTSGYLTYMRKFKKELARATNLNRALKAYDANPVRGWDIVNMGRRKKA